MLNDVCYRRIHGADNITALGIAVPVSGHALFANSIFVMDGTTGVILLNPASHGSLVRAESCLVAQAPHNDAGMVLVSFHHANGTVQESVGPVRVRA